MKIKFDKHADAAYIYLDDTKKDQGSVAQTVPGEPGTPAQGVNLDFDSGGKLVGIEIENASQKLSPLLLINE